MQTLLMPKKTFRSNDLVVLSRKEYESFLLFKKFKEFMPTHTEKQALLKAERNFKKRKTLSYNEVARGLGFTN